MPIARSIVLKHYFQYWTQQTGREMNSHALLWDNPFLLSIPLILYIPPSCPALVLSCTHNFSVSLCSYTGLTVQHVPDMAIISALPSQENWTVHAPSGTCADAQSGMCVTCSLLHQMTCRITLPLGKLLRCQDTIRPHKLDVTTWLQALSGPQCLMDGIQQLASEGRSQGGDSAGTSPPRKTCD